MILVLAALHNLFKMIARINNTAKCEVEGVVQFLMMQNNPAANLVIFWDQMSWMTAILDDVVCFENGGHTGYPNMITHNLLEKVNK